MAFPDLSRYCRHALAQMRFALNSLYHNESHTIANTKTALTHSTHSQSEGGRGDVFLARPFQLSLFYMVVNMRASLATFLRGKTNVGSCRDFAEWEFPALCRLIATLRGWTNFQANHDMLQCNMINPHHCETATAVPMHMTEVS